MPILGSAVKNKCKRGSTTVRIKKYLPERKKTDSTIKAVKCGNHKEVRVDDTRDKKELIKI